MRLVLSESLDKQLVALVVGVRDFISALVTRRSTGSWGSQSGEMSEMKAQLIVVHQLSPELTQQLYKLTSATERLFIEIGKRKEQHYTFEGGSIVKDVQGTTPNVAVKITPFTGARDAEGSKVNVSGFGYPVESTDDEAVKFVPKEGSPVDGQGNPLEGEFSFGTPTEDGGIRSGTATISCVDGAGKVLTVLFSETYNVSAGAPATFEGGSAEVGEPQA